MLNTKRRLGFLAGSLMVICCAAMRLRSAEGVGDVIMALSLTGIELAAVLFLEYQASKFEVAMRSWEARRSVEEGKARLHDAAKVELERNLAARDKLQKLIDEHIHDIADRQPRFASLAETAAAFTKRILNGYHAGIARNRGFLLGTFRRSK
jgi:hypothetical protein